MLEHAQLKEILPHAYPFLLIDRVTEIKEGESLTAIKNLTSNDWPFQGYFNDSNVFPETLLIEASAQVALVLYHLSRNKDNVKLKYKLGIVKAKFNGVCRVGQELVIRAHATKMLKKLGISDIVVECNENLVLESRIYYSVDWEIGEDRV